MPTRRRDNDRARSRGEVGVAVGDRLGVREDLRLGNVGKRAAIHIPLESAGRVAGGFDVLHPDAVASCGIGGNRQDHRGALFEGADHLIVRDAVGRAHGTGGVPAVFEDLIKPSPGIE